MLAARFPAEPERATLESESSRLKPALAPQADFFRVLSRLDSRDREPWLYSLGARISSGGDEILKVR